MPRDDNAQIAVDLYRELHEQYNWAKEDAWKGIAILLLSCKIWRDGWRDFHRVVVYRESNDFKITRSGPNSTIRKAQKLTNYLAAELGLEEDSLCASVGKYWENKNITALQPHNLVGHAFRSIFTEILKIHGDTSISYDEEVNPYEEFHGYRFDTRSKKPKIDIVARKDGQTVALLSTRWRYRHDRVEVVDESYSYIPVARRINRYCNFYAVIGEFSPARIEKILDHSPPKHAHGPIAAAVHFNPLLIKEGLEENGRIEHLKSLPWLIDKTFEWSTM
jgi:hypothetical protein